MFHMRVDTIHICCSGMRHQEKLATQSGRRHQNMRSKCSTTIHVCPVHKQSILIHCSTCTPWLDVTEWGVLGHTRATKGRNLGCFAEIDPRIDSHSWASLVWMEECWTTVCDFGTKLVYRLAQHGPCTCRQWWWWWRAVIKAQLLEAWLELEIILYPFCQGFKHSKCGVLSTFNFPQKSDPTTWDRISNFWNDILFMHDLII